MSNQYTYNYNLYNGDLSYSDIKTLHRLSIMPTKFDSKVYVVPYNIPNSWSNHKYVELDKLEYCSFGDYDNSGSVERANYKYIKENYDDIFNVFIWECYGSYGSQGLFTIQGLFELIDHYPYVTASSLRRWLTIMLGYSPEKFTQDQIDQLVSLKEEVDGLRNYPALDDDTLYELENDLTLESLFDHDTYDIMQCLDGLVTENYPNIDMDFSQWLDNMDDSSSQENDYTYTENLLLKLWQWIESNNYGHYENESSYMYMYPRWEKIFKKHGNDILELLHDTISQFIVDYAKENGASEREMDALISWLNNETVEF
jgi:hypothetical protein